MGSASMNLTIVNAIGAAMLPHVEAEFRKVTTWLRFGSTMALRRSYGWQERLYFFEKPGVYENKIVPW
jgi:hypothetical protein